MRTHSNSDFQEDPADEPIGESFLNPWGWAAAMAFVAVCAFVQSVDQYDRSTEWARSTELKAQQNREAQAERRERAAQAMCTSDFGPQVLAVWVAENTIECVSPQGKRLSFTPVDEAVHAAR